MFKARVAGGALLLGITRRNVELLEQGKPILFDGKEAMLPGVPKVVIFFVENDADLPAALEAMGVPMTTEQRSELTRRLDHGGNVPKGDRYRYVRDDKGEGD